MDTYCEVLNGEQFEESADTAKNRVPDATKHFVDDEDPKRGRIKPRVPTVSSVPL